MIEYFLWAVSLLGLYIGVFWAQVAFAPEKEDKKKRDLPTVSFLIPAWNEEKTLEKTVNSVKDLNYPKDKLQIIIVNDGSIDRTEMIANTLIQENPESNILLINRTRSKEQFTKAPALNTGLREAKGEFIACLDSDSTVEPDSLRKIFKYFDEEKVAAVISTIKVANPNTVYAKIQRIEYILATFVRKLMSKIDTLHITPGALSVYRTKVIKELGYFDENNITEDYEIAVRLRYHGYKIKIQTDSISYTNVPDTFKSLWTQRVRWFRGFITTSLKYKDMFANNKFGMMGVFQYPLNIISFAVVILTFILLAYESIKGVYHFGNKLNVLGWSIVEVFEVPAIKDIILRLNLKVTFPIVVSFAVAIFIYYLAHRTQQEKLRHPFALVAYLTIYPPLRATHWLTATYKELFRKKRKW